jgi:DNA-binding winged helix-turn-helix (wHTH) protein/tetratricopeptide (TPR) repeat protein
VLFEFEDFVLDEAAYELRRGCEVLKVDHKAFGMLAYLLRRPGQLVTKEELVNCVWEGRALSDTVLSGTVSRLRKALNDGRGEDLVVSVYGRGYRFLGTVRERASRTNRHSTEIPVVGRNVALARVQRCLEQARIGHGRIVSIAGEPGIGKTQLAELAAEKASELGILAAWGYCREGETAPPFWPFIQLLRGSLRPSGGSAAARTALDSALTALMPERSPAGWGADASGYRLLDGVARALQKMTEEGPLLLVLDDLQWADAASVRLLAYLAPEIARMPLVILATVRNTEGLANDARLAQVLGHRQCEHIELDRLTATDVAEYTEAWLGKPASEVSQAVFATSAGNPFFMVELLRPFRNSDPPPVDELVLTGPALDIVRQRLRTLGPEATKLLAAAAVVGSDFDLGVLGYVAELDPRGLVDTLETPRKTSAILASAGRPGHFVFGHDLIRSVLLEDLPTSERARLHLRAAEVLERRHPVGDGIPRAELVHHLLSALPLGDVPKAVEYAKRSALAATHVCAHADAAVLLRRALAALEVSSDAYPRLRADLLIGLSLCGRAYADERFPEHLAEAAKLGLEHGFGEILSEAGRHMSIGPGFMTMKGAREVLEAADRALPPDNALLRSHVLTHMSWTAPYCYDSELVASLVARAEALARASRDPEAIASTLSAKLYFENGPDSRDLAAATFRQIALLYADSTPLVRVYWSAQMQFSRIVMSLQQGDAEAVQDAVDAFGAAARELKHPELEWHHRRVGVVQRMNRGDFDGLPSVLMALHEEAEGLRLFSLRGVRALDWIVLRRETDSMSNLPSMESALVVQDSDCPYRRARKIRSLAELGAIESARTALHELAPAALGRLPHDRDYLATLVHFSVASIATRSEAHAEALYALLSPYPHWYAADLSMHCDGSVSHFLGTLARSLGRTREATRHLEEALEYNERAGFAPQAAHSAYELARALSDPTSPQGGKRVQSLLARVIDMTRRIGMAPLAHDAQEQLQGY